ncbi:MAG TPA: hypothetical protein VIN04_05285 [Myxococcota bacterium]
MPVARLRLLPLLLLLATTPATRAAAEVLYATEFGPPLFASQQPIVGVDGWLAGWSQTGGFITYELVEPMGLWLAENNLPDPNRSAIGRPVAVPADRPTTLRLLLLPAQLAPDRIFGVGFGVGPGVYGTLVGGASFDAAGNVRLAPHITGLSSGEPVGAIPFDAPFWMELRFVPEWPGARYELRVTDHFGATTWVDDAMTLGEAFLPTHVILFADVVPLGNVEDDEYDMIGFLHLVVEAVEAPEPRAAAPVAVAVLLALARRGRRMAVSHARRP